MTLSLRDLWHFLAAYIGAIIPALSFTSVGALKATLLAAVPGALSVIFRQLVPPKSDPPVVVVDTPPAPVHQPDSPHSEPTSPVSSTPPAS